MFESKIRRVMDNTTCKKHDAWRGNPCFHIPKENGFGYFAGICNGRAKKIYTGTQSQRPSKYPSRNKKENAA